MPQLIPQLPQIDLSGILGPQIPQLIPGLIGQLQPPAAPVPTPAAPAPSPVPEDTHIVHVYPEPAERIREVERLIEVPTIPVPWLYLGVFGAGVVVGLVAGIAATK